MVIEQATQVRKEWSMVCDSVMHDRPKFIMRTRDKMALTSLDTLQDMLSGYTFTANKYIEDDGSVTLSLIEIDLIENGSDEDSAKAKLGNAILEYANEFYEEYALYSKSKNRKNHIPYIFKALIIDNAKLIGDSITCQDGEN